MFSNVFDALSDCLRAHQDHESVTAKPDIVCAFLRRPISDFDAVQTPCSSEQWSLSTSNWEIQNTNDGLQLFVAGGQQSTYSTPSKSNGFSAEWWPGIDFSKGFANEVGKQLLGKPNFDCSLANPCKDDLVCTSIGSRIALGFTHQVLPSFWGFFVVASMVHLNQQLQLQSQAISRAVASTALDSFNLDDFYRDPDSGPKVENLLSSIGPILSLFSGVQPLGPALSASSNVLSAFSGYFSGSITQSEDPDFAQKTFAPQAKAMYRQFGLALDQAATDLFRGKSVSGTNITDMLNGGTWVNSTALTPVSGLEIALNVEVTSRAIDQLWKKPPYNKIWVLFLDLGDITTNQSCLKDRSGPQDSKYCADEGVYYTYNFEEAQSYAGYVAYPWGGEKLGEIGLKIRV